MNATCAATKRDGNPCTLPSNGPGAFCWAHSPAMKERRRRGQSRGGRGKTSRELLDLKRRASELAEDVLAGMVDKGSAAVAGQLYNVCIRALSESVRARESEEYEQRLREVEERIAAPPPPWLTRGGV